ncbi:carbon-nitrogen hydrolase family protein [Jannaschia sp. CCS1]|uniref:carbon-nitrogen hydrolase family protein n=1 Tax=Jannaschia sp. (strain CCS1) TaxID=290400 RepID=UPI00006C00EC|nr:carbon-nitrogen hydrolase family protein [Jannaschia sp. CCS1]ABD56599.1 Nitrilase/cyanide hydratase and apolipoprotein N-acyltransferase [Jannaschia sp. CCS1]
MDKRETLSIAIGQMCSAKSQAENLETVKALADQAKGQGAEMLALPEVSSMMNADRASAKALVVAAEDDLFIRGCRDLAARHGIWIHTGSTPVLALDGRFFNRATLIDKAGEIRAAYDKIHLFDVDVPDATFKESKAFAPGNEAMVVDTPWGVLGLSICYDLRFAYLYRAMAQAGAQVMFIPAAFTVPTGKAHWHVLMRARAIETGSFVIAPAQAGHHDDGRDTYGHSLAVDPWGRVIADLEDVAPKVQVVTLDLAQCAKVRGQIPALANGREVPLRQV